MGASAELPWKPASDGAAEQPEEVWELPPWYGDTRRLPVLPRVLMVLAGFALNFAILAVITHTI